nr:reverse transcriptase domain-containing protein [Tanacetum cinerariifolium]
MDDSHWTESVMADREKAHLIWRFVLIPLQKKHKRSNRRRILNIVEPEIRTIEEIVLMANRTMEDLLQAPTKGYGEAIVILKILAEYIEIKTNLLQLVQANKFHGFERDDPDTHISNFKRTTATLKYRDVPNDAIKLMLFSYSLEGDARIWYEKEPPNSIRTWDDLVSKFVNQFFLPSKTTHLKNKISRFTQRFEETFGEAWDRFKEMLRACPHHGFSKLTQIDTFYNGLTEDNVSKTDDRIDKLADQISNLVEIVNKQVIAPAKAVEKTCVTCGGAHAYYDCIATDNALLLMPKFASTIKSLLANKDTLFELAKVPLNENCSAMLLKKLPEKLGDSGKFLIPCDFPRIEIGRLLVPKELLRTYLSREEITLRLNDESVTFNLNQTMRYSSTYDDNSVNRVDVIDIACEDFVQDVLDFQYNPKSSSPTLVFDVSISESDSCKDPIVKSSSLTFTLFGESDFFLEEIEDFLNDDSIPTGIENSVYDPKGDILFLEKLLNEDPFQLPPMDLKLAEESKAKSSVEEPPELELKELPSHLEYAFLEDSNKLPVIIAKILKEEVIKLLDTGMIYPISDSLWVSPIHCVPKKGGYFQIPIDPQDQKKLLSHALMEPSRTDACPLACVMLQDFSKIARPMTHLLEKETPFVFSKECIDAFNTLKKKLTEAPILVVPDWNLPFELMCDASDYAIGAVLRQCKMKHFKPIHYASKTMTEPQIHYTITEKEMLAVLLTSSKLAMRDPLGAIMVPISQRRRDKAKSLRKMRCLRTISKFVRYSIYGWVEAKALPTNDVRVVVKFLTSLFSRFGIPRAIINDRGTHFCNDQFTRVMIKYGRTVGENRASWSDKLDDALWVSCTAYKTPIGCTPYKLVYGKSCHLPIELEHRAYWALKHVNFDLKTTGDHRKLQLNELSELRDKAYKNSVVYKERTKKLHDSKIKNRIFNVGDQVLLFNSRLKIFSRKWKTHWSGPFTITCVFSYGTIKLSQPNGPNFKVNGHRVKHYFGGDIPSNVAPDLHMFPMDN